jgi:putative transposase
VQTEQETVVPVNRGPAVGIDLGSAQAVVLSDESIIRLPRTARDDRRRLANAQRVVARRRKGSRNREKARRRVARIQARYARRRRDAAHKATTAIAKNHGVVVIEDPQVKEMTSSGSTRPAASAGPASSAPAAAASPMPTSTPRRTSGD